MGSIGIGGVTVLEELGVTEDDVLLVEVEDDEDELAEELELCPPVLEWITLDVLETEDITELSSGVLLELIPLDVPISEEEYVLSSAELLELTLLLCGLEITEETELELSADEPPEVTTLDVLSLSEDVGVVLHPAQIAAISRTAAAFLNLFPIPLPFLSTGGNNFLFVPHARRTDFIQSITRLSEKVNIGEEITSRFAKKQRLLSSAAFDIINNFSAKTRTLIA